MRNLKAFLGGLCFVAFVSVTSEAFAWTIDYSDTVYYKSHSCGTYLNQSEAWAEMESRIASGLAPKSNDQTYIVKPHDAGWNLSCNSNGRIVTKWETRKTECPVGETLNEETNRCEPPPCESPNYIDSDSGECVAPEEICFTTIESMATECVYIGEDDPEDDVPEGCVEDVNSGSQICLSEEPGCYVADGKTICPTPDMICGTKNGTFSCVAPEQEGCGYFNGEKVCFTPDGDKVENTSPDHPDNGGNLDGDDTNDMFDSRDPADGGDPDNQIDSPIEPTQDGDRATEKTSRDQLRELKKINESLDKMGKGTPLSGNEASSKIDSVKDQLITDTGVDGVIGGMESNPFGAGDLGSVPGIADGLVPEGTCTAYSQDVLGFGTFSISCDDTSLLRTILEWVFYVVTAIYLFQLLTTPVRS